MLTTFVVTRAQSEVRNTAKAYLIIYNVTDGFSGFETSLHTFRRQQNCMVARNWSSGRANFLFKAAGAAESEYE